MGAVAASPDPRCSCRRVAIGRKVKVNRCPEHAALKGHSSLAFGKDGMPDLKICALCGAAFMFWNANKKQIFCSKSCALTIHGGVGKEGYGSWKGMIDRCHNASCRDYKNYGARGIAVCDEWRNDFNAFISYIGPRPSPKHSVDRYPNNNGNYEPGNVRWASQKQQTRNMRTNNYIPLGEAQDPILTDFAAREGVSAPAIRNRIKKGIPLDQPYFGTGVTLKCAVCGYSWTSLKGKPINCARHGCRSKYCKGR